MPFSVVCPACHSRLKIPDQSAGHALRCPRCKQKIESPAAGPESAPTAVCPQCGQKRIFDMNDLFAVLGCSSCGCRFTPMGGAVHGSPPVQDSTPPVATPQHDFDDQPPRQPINPGVILAGGLLAVSLIVCLVVLIAVLNKDTGARSQPAVAKADEKARPESSEKELPGPGKKEAPKPVEKAVPPAPAEQDMPKPAAPREQVNPQPEEPKPMEKPKEPGAQDLLEKGRDLCRTFEYSLAEAYFTKAQLLCDDSTDGQLLKAELYVRIALVREFAKRNLKPHWSDDESRWHFRRIMTAQGKSPSDFTARDRKIHQDHIDLFNEGLKRKKP